MEFATEEEMREYLGKDAKGFDIKSGFVGITGKENDRIDETHHCPEPPMVHPEPMKVVGAYVNGSIMYVAKKGTTFNAALAKKMPKSEADKKAAAMTKRGNYTWKVF